MKATDNRKVPNVVNSSCLMSEAAFGHVGAGGSLGFADPECRLSFGYAMNRMGTGILLNARGQTLVDAAYAALDTAPTRAAPGWRERSTARPKHRGSCRDCPRRRRSPLSGPVWWDHYFIEDTA